jgi:hypothetical protein
MNTRPSNARLVALCVLGCFLLSYPLISLFNLPRLVWGIPVLYAYLFFVWLVLIVASALVVEQRGARRSP